MDPVKEGEESGDDDEDGDSNRDVKKQSLSLKSDKSVDKTVKRIPAGVENVDRKESPTFVTSAPKVPSMAPQLVFPRASSQPGRRPSSTSRGWSGRASWTTPWKTGGQSTELPG